MKKRVWNRRSESLSLIRVYEAITTTHGEMQGQVRYHRHRIDKPYELNIMWPDCWHEAITTSIVPAVGYRA